MPRTAIKCAECAQTNNLLQQCINQLLDNEKSSDPVGRAFLLRGAQKFLMEAYDHMIAKHPFH